MVGCHSFDRDQGEEGYFLISAHILLVHGHVMPLTTRLLALRGGVPVSPLFRNILRKLLAEFREDLPDLDGTDRMAVYEARDRIFLTCLAARETLYRVISCELQEHLSALGTDPSPALQTLELDQALCPRGGSEHTLQREFNFDANEIYAALSSMELPAQSAPNDSRQNLQIRHPGGLGEILLVADGGSWLRGVIEDVPQISSDIEYVAIA